MVIAGVCVASSWPSIAAMPIMAARPLYISTYAGWTAEGAG